MKYSILIATTALTFSFGAALPAIAGNGVFNFLDPCVEARDDFRDQRFAILAAYDTSISDADSAEVTAEYTDAWTAAKKKQLRPIFDADVAPTLMSMGVEDVDKAYGIWFEKALSQFGDQLDHIVTANFRKELKEVRIEEKATTKAELERQKNELHAECKMDVGNQVLRGAITAAVAPIDIVKGNFESAKREANVVTQTVRATTGVSLRDIQQNGPAGGETSEARKAGRAIAKVFGW